jgi:hypothetical protein
LTSHLEVVPEFKDTLDRPAWWFKEQWLWARAAKSEPIIEVKGGLLAWALAGEDITPPPAPNSADNPAPVNPEPSVPRPVKPVVTYLLGVEGSPLVKIGHTTASPKSRMASLQTGLPMQLSLLWSYEGDFESALHIHFAAYRVRGEWFDLTSLGDSIDVVKAAVGEIEAARA